MECICQRQVGYPLGPVEPFVVTWHVANVTNLIISTVSLTGANIEVRHAKNESSMIMDRCCTQTSVILHRSKSCRESYARAHTHEFPQLVQLLRAGAADDPHHRQPHEDGGLLHYAGCTWQ